MRRSIVAALAALAFALSAAPATAQTHDKPSEPAPPITGIASDTVEITKILLSVDGKPVEAAPPGVEVALIMTIRNAGSDALQDLSLTLAAGPDGLKVTDGEAAIGDLDPGDSADGRFAFVLDAKGCFEFIGLAGEAVYEGGAAPIKVAIPAACPGPRISLGEVTFSGGDGDGVPEPGETLRVTFELANHGNDVARNVRATVKISGDGLSASGADLEWPDVEPKGSARNVEPLTLLISSGADRQEACEAQPPLPGNDPAIDGGPIPPDTAVSSDGSVSSGGGAGTPGSEPAGAGTNPQVGGSFPGSTGTSEEEPATSIVEPQPSTIEPDPGTGGGAEPGTIEPQPLPPDASAEPLPLPVEPAPQPEPAGDQPVQIQALLSISAEGYETAAEWANGTFCAMDLGAPTDALGARGASEDASAARGETALPVAVAAGISAATLILRRKLTG